MRAVLDANVLVSAAVNRDGTPGQLVAGWLDGRFELVVSPLLLAEAERALGYPRVAERLPAGRARELLWLLRSEAALADDPVTLTGRSRDPGDDYLLALAESTRSVLVTGDGDLLALRDQYPVWTPAEMVAALDAAGV